MYTNTYTHTYVRTCIRTCIDTYVNKYVKKGKPIPLQVWTGPDLLQEVEAPRFQENQHMNVVKLSALRTGRIYPPGNIPGTHFC